MTVGLVIVSHSAKIAEGVVDLAAQMAPSTRIVAAGGSDDGGIGTGFDRVTAAIEAADDGDGVVVLCDLGSAILTAETVLDFLDGDQRARVLIADAPIVEGSVTASVAAEGGGALTDVRAAAESANGARGSESGEAETSGAETSGAEPSGAESAAAVGSGPDETAAGLPAADGGGAPPVERSVVLQNADGLHARPAAALVTLARRFSARVTVDGIDSTSLLGIMSSGSRAGHEVRLVGSGPDAAEAVDAIAELIESGFGEAG